MSECCSGLAEQFDEGAAERDYRRLVRRGPDRTTRWLVEMLAARGVADARLLDIGGGVGALQGGLLAEGAVAAVSVDASPAYVRVAERLARERGYERRVERIVGDFVAEASRVPGADVVTLDRVICCYPDVDRLVTLSAERARRAYGIVVPRDHVANRVGVRVLNLVRALRGSAFRAYIHPLDRIEALVGAAGLRPVGRRRTLGWETVVFAR